MVGSTALAAAYAGGLGHQSPPGISTCIPLHQLAFGTTPAGATASGFSRAYRETVGNAVEPPPLVDETSTGPAAGVEETTTAAASSLEPSAESRPPPTGALRTAARRISSRTRIRASSAAIIRSARLVPRSYLAPSRCSNSATRC
eukprot:scaffold46410_cov30-Tisochrysis_lutea.AAC.1